MRLMRSRLGECRGENCRIAATGTSRPVHPAAAAILSRASKRRIDRVRSLGLDELRALWRVTFRCSPPPAFTKDPMARFLCWHIQEQAFGGLDPKTAKHLDGPARGDRRGAERPPPPQ